MKAARVLDCQLDCLSSEELEEEVVELIRSNQRGILCTVNVAILIMMRSNPLLQDFAGSARWTVADGQPLVWLSRVFGSTPIPERLAGVDLLSSLCERAMKERFGVYLLGSTRDSVEKAAATLGRQFPGLDIRGVADGYFGEVDAPARAKAIEASGAMMLFVGMGAPMQETFIAQYWSQLGVPFAMGVGGSFDVVAGLKRRAPRLLQRFGLEWAFRLYLEPRRLYRRYLVSNLKFFGLMLRELGRLCLRSNRLRSRIKAP